jgi:hypothetical protein
VLYKENRTGVKETPRVEQRLRRTMLKKVSDIPAGDGKNASLNFGGLPRFPLSADPVSICLEGTPFSARL